MVISKKKYILLLILHIDVIGQKFVYTHFELKPGRRLARDNVYSAVFSYFISVVNFGYRLTNRSEPKKKRTEQTRYVNLKRRKAFYKVAHATCLFPTNVVLPIKDLFKSIKSICTLRHVSFCCLKLYRLSFSKHNWKCLVIYSVVQFWLIALLCCPSIMWGTCFVKNGFLF